MSGTAEVQFASGRRRFLLQEFSTGCTSKTEAEAVGALRSSRIRDEGIDDTRGRDKRPGLDALLKGVARREFDIIADLRLGQQALDTSTPSGRMLFGMLGVFSEFERAMIRDRVLAGLDRARSSGKRLGRPRTTPFQMQRIRLALDEGRGVRETARLLKVSAAKVSEVRRMSAATAALGAD